MTDKPVLTVQLASPRGFCAGVDRAIQIVEKALERYGAPVFVRHEIVHNKHVVNRLEAMGAVFVKELDECPDDRPVVFSAHGVPQRVPAEAARREMLYVDATCPLVSKVHVEAQRHHKSGQEILLIGHAGHPEVIGTMGQLPDGVMHLIETVEDAQTFEPKDPDNIAFVTQTTLSVDDTADIVAALQKRFPNIAAPHKEDICYATTNRQAAVKAIGEGADLVLVVGAPNSSNSVRLVEVAERAGAKAAHLVQKAEEIDWSWLEGVERLGVSAGASAPEELVEGLLSALARRYTLHIREVRVAEENVVFKLPKEVA
ncbi:MAG: 4-hydroxy-3-methylbut-2-enyl diphosphate reductase [Oceanicaulis sp.]|jgi:4-hydroxy-3-methylbut-2-enyl diphosphate reductase|uniref:4-hydroxy-3-methylbut-2-enyl diphosphate reductase n=1 Tax=Oceanicaulis TaxID=153232 RepID=UPI000C09AD83|nr:MULTISPECIES: 4-hydroxy-3-methylbut-2-enyl diphosphate reductase [Oceanicaulis]MAP49384.1 4-hydroxy-3-methylbut-2-enyl diphosphate reductase [Oceanicaulis sp.]MBL4538122.1 4-hydroxy-3-methylbut-2-enyl diphosphate reductase [Oceanicaulis sp.]VXC67878.1 1-hydroxy-2-methyl-2-(E)-butenyl 4-diphosphate reductase, 4Fe-4S protein [Oceanicaulis sp. 350]